MDLSGKADSSFLSLFLSLSLSLSLSLFHRENAIVAANNVGDIRASRTATAFELLYCYLD